MPVPDARLRDFIMSRFQPDLVTEPKYVAWPRSGRVGGWLVGWLWCLVVVLGCGGGGGLVVVVVVVVVLLKFSFWSSTWFLWAGFVSGV